MAVAAILEGTRPLLVEVQDRIEGRFPDADPEHEKLFAALLEREIPTWDLSLSLDRLLAALREKGRIAAGLDADFCILDDDLNVTGTVIGGVAG